MGGKSSKQKIGNAGEKEKLNVTKNKEGKKSNPKKADKKETKILKQQQKSSAGNIMDIEFGKPCVMCSQRKSIPPKHKYTKVYCKECFRVKCLRHKCPDSSCKMFLSIMEERITEVSKVIRNSILNRRGNVEFIQERNIAQEDIHGSILKSTITLTKRFLPDTEKDAHSENFIDIEVNGDNFFFVQLDVPSKYKYVGVFGKGGTDMERKFINAFQDRFRNEPVIIQTGSCLEFLKKCDGPVILICLCLSRLLSDVKYTLDGVEGRYFKRIMVVLLHYKFVDTKPLADEVRKDGGYSELQVIDCYQQENINNTTEVMMYINDFIFRL